MFVLGSQVNQITQEVKEFRFVKGKVWPSLCGAETVSRNGKYNGKQRYKCNVASAYTKIVDFREGNQCLFNYM